MGRFSALNALKSLCDNECTDGVVSRLRQYTRLKSWSPEDRQTILEALSELVVSREWSPRVVSMFGPILSDLLMRCKRKPQLRGDLFVSLSHLIGYYPSATHFAYQCFQTSLFSAATLVKSCDDHQFVLNVFIACFNYLHFNPLWFRDAIDWSFILQYISHPECDIRYIAIQCHRILFAINDNQFECLFKPEFSEEDLTRLRVKYLYLFSSRNPTVNLKNSLYYQRCDEVLSDSQLCFKDDDFCEDIVSVEGVLINKFAINSEWTQRSSFSDENRIVLLPTTQSNLRCLALGVAYGKPVLIEGPIGCGKTLLVEYIASLSGRHKAPQLMKVQMGDQIDAKVLIGSHICTDIPGEFLWKAGPLTEAMKHGFWLLLEDIDCAPSDVISMLMSVLESNSLASLPGCENQLNRVHNEFRIFFTRRLIGSQNNESATKAFLDSNDCFLQSISDPKLRVSKAEVIGSHLNITQSQSEFLCCKRKPELIVNENLFRIGRFSVGLKERQINLQEEHKFMHSFALTHQSLSLLERISVAIDNKEPVLLCGETGTGKTSCVQYLAKRLHKSLTVINMNQQSDSSDLLGGYKPIEINVMIGPIKEEYLDLFSLTFESDKNVSFLTKFAQIFKSEEWATLFKVMLRVYESALTKCKDNHLLERWKALGERINRLQSFQLNQKGCLAFSFIEGSLVKAMRSGGWILLDEINLAESETLQCLSAILDSDEASLALLDKADGIPVERNPEFRLFGCMNPATDVGKKELPLGIRNRFTELFVDQLEDKSDLRILIHSYIGKYVSPGVIEAIVDFYLQIKCNSKTVLTDANGLRPHYSLSKDSVKVLNAKIQSPKFPEKYESIEDYYILRGSKEPKVNESYILTDTVKKNLKDICRIVSIGKTFPILLEGETSVGKTSLIEWLAAATGNVCVRVNNHEHTDLQEYVGSYCVDTDGKLIFREGVLAEAMRNGYWIILDELNLAPTDVLEALNRVLDDNRELFIPETQQLIKANPKFLLLATQNPAGHYGGRKMLSRAFRNRFVELHFNEIPNEELEIILHQRCALPLSYAKRMVGVLHDLQIRRRESGVFAGKHGFITLRDLFRWGERYKKFAKQQNKDIQFYDWDLHLANDGYMLLAGRVRRPEEVTLIQSVLETRFKRTLDTNVLFSKTSFLNDAIIPTEFKHIVWNKSFKRLGTLLSEAIKYNEPVLLVGETGCGKTSICQLFAALNNKSLFSVNCHMNTESADFLGSLRPVRNFEDETDSQTTRPLFEWVDGPLVDAMKSGDYFMVDEISLADDSVLERLNSVLEPEKTLLLAENNNTFESEISIPVIKAKESFRYMATMNPGGDYGKKELSPALRNRFTEIWCPPYEDIEDIRDIIRHNLDNQWSDCKDIVCQSMCDFLLWFNTNVKNSKRIVLSIRDILSWIHFINSSTQSNNAITMSISNAFINGALLVFVDAIGSAGSAFNSSAKNSIAIRSECQQYLNQLSQPLSAIDAETNMQMDVVLDESKHFSIKPFCISKGPDVDESINSYYMWNSPTVQTNALRVVRAMQLPKPILLEGMPGVGKTTLIQALAKASGHRLIRINLSEQTDISDLFGADLPLEGEDSVGKFAFRDGPLLQALKSEWTWILFDELNLAQQSVLEGLNACLDHRSEIFVSELNKSFKISKTMTRIFATQNPYSEGGARKGLPKSLLNRFTSVYMQNLSNDDYIFILSHLFPKVQQSVIKTMVDFNNEVIDEIVIANKFGQRGSPWEFNLRELIRWSQLMTHNVMELNDVKPENFVKFLYIDKMRTTEDRHKMKDICDKYFPNTLKSDTIEVVITDNYLQIGHSFLKRRRTLGNEMTNYMIFESQKECLQSLMKCIEMNWMSILIGESGVGKTSVVKLLSDLTGHKLRIFSVNSEMDTMDLLGGFEQKDLSHHLTHIEESVFDLCLTSFGKSVDHKENISQILKLWFEIQTLNSDNDSVNPNVLLEKLKILDQIINKLEECNESVSNITSDLKQQIISLKSNYETKVLVSGAFEWRDSILIRALMAGEWLLIDNANLCSASVLDRLNGLLEPNGELTINEKGSIDGQMTTIKPHPHFRLILAMNPMNGELSRAMRNRGIEIYMFPINAKQDFVKQVNGLCWQNMREEQELKRSEEEALFEYRMKTECSDVTEEERERLEMEAIFPTYNEQYFDVSDEFEGNEITLRESKIEDEMISDIIRSHLKIVELSDKSDKSVHNFRKAYLLRHSVISQITKRLGIFFDYSIDSQLIDGHMIACNELIADIKDSSYDSFNIYHNSSLYETSLCFKILESMEKKIITELLPQFESHPILIKLLKIIQKIFDLRSNEPLINFATGLEVLLQAAQDWQLMAHKGISLSDNLNEMTQLLISWRKLELKYWSECLDSVNKDIEDKQMNLFCDESNDKNMGTELKDVQDGGLGEGEGTKDVSDKIESEDQLEDALKSGAKEEGKGDENEEKDIEEEDNGIEMENDFDGQMYSPSKGDNEEEEDDRKSDEDESDNNLEDQMGDVDNNSEVLDEKIWGSDEENSDSDEADGDDETGFGGKDTIDNKVVAKDENKDLPKDKELDEKEEEEDNNENELEINENENELQSDEYKDETIDPYKDIEPKTDKSQQELPENMELDDNEDNDQNEESGEQKDDISVSGQSSGDSETDEQNLDDMNASEEEFDDNTANENESKIEDLENKVDENETKDEVNEDIVSEEKESKPNPKEAMDSTNDQTFSAENYDKSSENENNAKNSSDVCVEENAEQKTEESVAQNEEQHGFNDSLVGDNSTQSESKQLQSSAALDDSDGKEEKLQQNYKREKTRRTLADNYDKSAKRQKVMPNESEDNSNTDPKNKNESENQMIDSELYRHVDNKLNANNKVIDIASNEEKEIQREDIESESKDDIDLNKPEEMDIEENNELIDTLKAIDVKSEKNKLKSSNKSDANKEELNEEVMEMDGEIVPTLTVQRGSESTFHTSIDFNDIQELSETTLIEKRFDDLSVKTLQNLDTNSVIDVWKECEAKVSPLVYELCERLQLVLEPTKMAKLRGDYRTGKRLNMRKVIAYIASDFRKDKIWLRRTKASKRQYQIIIAVDDSSSMSDNKSKQLAFESLALLGKSLTLLEAGELAIMSFGQTVRLLHGFNDAFNENTGANLLTQLTFEQKETRIADLLESTIQLLSTSRRRQSSQKEDISQLLIIVSDGRGIYSEGEQRVRQLIRKMKELGIFVVFVVIDNPLNKDSILDIRVPIFSSSGSVQIESYMERFPFQFYILLRDINGLPVVMGEALRQWFELITSGQS
ncbi:unnamed protein product [Oppiella nova]|uniref:Midasin n=1 Tax=Oppiella nova TaxID=334625 RepID=A0A7R9LCI0_9ACAR|nr:unnamed protein product [Oppiella nova]CAG2161607.1 unnamed protein product [Oppiella nova]